MPFHDRQFLLIFLPVFFLLIFLAGSSRWLAVSVLSLAYIAVSGWVDLLVIIVSIAVNYSIGLFIRQSKPKESSAAFYAAILFNLAVMALGKKYFPGHGGLIPLGISFYSFEQIAFHIDFRKRKFPFPKFTEYLFFVSFLPHLVAGPLIRAGEIFDQIRERKEFSLNFSLGSLTLFGLGLAKKVLLADMLKPYVDHCYLEAGFSDASLGVGHFLYSTIGYGLQIYFDFSGYSDMAIALAAFIGIRLPLNFNSPLKAGNIAEFWRCWHMTLSSFVREYLYEPLKEVVHAPWQRRLLIIPVMGVLGLWHGMSWGFLAWGGAHGILLYLFSLWREWAAKKKANAIAFPVSSLLTLTFVYGLCPLFRGIDIEEIQRLFSSAWKLTAASYNRELWPAMVTLSLAAFIAHCAPNSNQIRQWVDTADSKFTLIISAGIVATLLCGILFSDHQAAFIYFKF